PRYRGRQVATWIYRKGVVDLDAMTDLPRDFRARLAETAEATLPEGERAAAAPGGRPKPGFPPARGRGAGRGRGGPRGRGARGRRRPRPAAASWSSAWPTARA